MEDNLQPRFKAIMGLGNPGRDYEATRHNLGFMVVDTLAGGRKFKAEKVVSIPAKSNYPLHGGLARPPAGSFF